MDVLRLGELQRNDVVYVYAGMGENTHRYTFSVQEPGERPLCRFSHRPPGEDESIGPVVVNLIGCVEPQDPTGAPDGEYAGELRTNSNLAITDQRPDSATHDRRFIFGPPIIDLFVTTGSENDEDTY